ncbi:MAG TPA: hypothetical protein VLM38_21360 [Blastocatellia bacterium]|nr:hypothetical protein [Blastocatellia bacterium]
MTNIIKSRAVVFGVALLIALAPLSTNSASRSLPQTVSTQSADSRRHSEQSIRTEGNTWTWRHVDDDARLEVSIRGHVEFAEDYSDITSISEGGSIRVTDEKGGVTRKFEARSTSSGIQRTYWLNGASRQFDQEAKAWLAKTLDDTVRQGGYDVRPRVRRILRESGPSAVLQEISRLKGDYVKRIYFDELVMNGNLDDQTIRQVLRQAATEIHSDYEKAQLLVRMSEDYLTNDSQRAIYLEGVNTIHSDYEKGRALGALLKKGNFGRENMLLAVKSASNINSDYEKAQFLIRVAAAGSSDESVRMALIDAARTIHSEYERGRVLSAVFK